MQEQSRRAARLTVLAYPLTALGWYAAFVSTSKLWHTLGIGVFVAGVYVTSIRPSRSADVRLRLRNQADAAGLPRLLVDGIVLGSVVVLGIGVIILVVRLI